MIREYIKLKKK